MTLLLEIPKEFAEHITYDKFQDSLERIYTDLKCKVGHGNLSGNFEMELLDMLMTAFNSAKVIQPLESLINTNLDEWKMKYDKHNK